MLRPKISCSDRECRILELIHERKLYVLKIKIIKLAEYNFPRSKFGDLLLFTAGI